MFMKKDELILKERADSGDPYAIFQLARYLSPMNRTLSIAYYLKLTEFDPKDLDFLGYATLLTYLGTTFHNDGNYEVAIDWYKKAMNYIKTNYTQEFGQEVLEDIRVKEFYTKAVLAAKQQSN